MEKNKKPIYTTTLVTDENLYEMVCDKKIGISSFVKISKDSEICDYTEEVEYLGDTYRPLQPRDILVDKHVVLFPEIALEYGPEEKLLEDIQSFIHKYVDISPEFENITKYYVLLTWLYDKFNEVPYLRVLGDYGSGKSRFLKTIGNICYKPIFTSGAATTSPIFRILDKTKGTLILDEADMRVSDTTTDLVKILNCGYEKGTVVLRTEGKENLEVKAYEVYGPKVIATRETFTDQALESRFLVEEMGAINLRSDIPKSLRESFSNEATVLRNKLLMFRMKNYFKEIDYVEVEIKDIHPRLNQIVLPLLSIIESESEKNKLIDFIKKYDVLLKHQRGILIDGEVFFALKRLKESSFDRGVTVKQIADEMNKERDDGDYKATARSIGSVLRKKLQFTTIRKGSGYYLDFSQNMARFEQWNKKFESDEQVNNVNIADGITTSSLGYNMTSEDVMDMF